MRPARAAGGGRRQGRTCHSWTGRSLAPAPPLQALAALHVHRAHQRAAQGRVHPGRCRAHRRLGSTNRDDEMDGSHRTGPSSALEYSATAGSLPTRPLRPPGQNPARTRAHTVESAQMGGPDAAAWRDTTGVQLRSMVGNPKEPFLPRRCYCHSGAFFVRPEVSLDG